MSDWVCGRCKSINRERAATCYSCGGIRGAIQLEPSGAVRHTGVGDGHEGDAGRARAAAAAPLATAAPLAAARRSPAGSPSPR